MERGRHNFLSFGVIFWPITIPPPSPNDPENQNFEKMKKMKKQYYPFTHV